MPIEGSSSPRPCTTALNRITQSFKHPCNPRSEKVLVCPPPLKLQDCPAPEAFSQEHNGF